jgi:putative redox protein
MKAIARRSGGSYTHSVEIRNHKLIVDEPEESGGSDEGPSPQELLAASLASCTAITIAMYAKRKDWAIEPLSVSVDYTPAQRGEPTKFALTVHLPSNATEEQREKLQVIARKCPIHRVLEGEVVFEERVALSL